MLLATALTPSGAVGAQSDSEGDGSHLVCVQVSEQSGSKLGAATGFQSITASAGAPPSASQSCFVAGGGGEGGSVSCETVALGPTGLAFQAIEEARAGGIPYTETQTYLSQEGISPGGGVYAWQDWFRLVGDEVQVLHSIRCDGDEFWSTEWITIGPGGRAMPTPQQFLPQLQDSVTERVPAPVARIAPADEDRNGWTYANFDTYFWVDAGPGQWDVVSATASVPGLSVTVQAVPQRLVVDPGDGSGAFSCEGRPPVASNDVWYDGMPGCIHRYVNSSSMSGNGETFRVTVAIDWAVRWSASNGESGSLGGLRTSGSRDLAVAEIQAINVPNP